MDSFTKRIGSCLCVVSALVFTCSAGAADPSKVLRLGFADVEGMDPHQSTDSYSQAIQRSIFEGLYEWDYLSRPTKLFANTAVALPDITDSGKTWTIRVKPGIFFTDDPAFGGKPRELVADDYVYSLKRFLDPALRFGGNPLITDAIVGARPLVDAARQPGAKFDYDAAIEGLRALDRYTLRLRLNEPNYPLIQGYLVTLAIARDVVEAAQGDIRTRAVGTGPYRLKEWKQGSRIVLEANPNYRTLSFPKSADPAHADLVRSMKGKNLPQIGVIEVSLIAEELPLLLEFERGKLDYVEFTTDVATRLLIDGNLKPELARRGTRYFPIPRSYTSFVYFNLDDPQLGGMSREHIALRRAIALGFDTASLAKTVYGGLALPLNQIVPPGVTGHDAKLSTKSLYDSAAARALLDRFGYEKRDREGFRTNPNGTPLMLTMLTRPDRDTRDAETLWKKNMEAIGLRMQFREVPFQDMQKEAFAGNYQLLHGLSWGGSPLGIALFRQLYGKEPPAMNKSRFRFTDYDEAMEQYMRMPTEQEQLPSAKKMSELALMYAPMVPTVVRLVTGFSQPWLMGCYPSPFWTYWKYYDIDIARRQVPGP